MSDLFNGSIIPEYWRIIGDRICHYVHGHYNNYVGGVEGTIRWEQKQLNAKLNFSPFYHRTELSAYKRLNILFNREIANLKVSQISERFELQKKIKELESEIELRRKCSEVHYERAEKFENQREALKKALKLVQGHAKNYYQENERLKNNYDEMQALNIALQKEHASAIENQKKEMIPT